MPYFFEAANSMWIREQEVGSGLKEIGFATFTSCIGVVAKVGELLIGVHLPMYIRVNRLEKTNNTTVDFDRTIAEEALKYLPKSADKFLVLGCLNSWAGVYGQEDKKALRDSMLKKGSSDAAIRDKIAEIEKGLRMNPVVAGYERLLSSLSPLEKYDVAMEDTSWSVKVEGSRFVPGRNLIGDVTKLSAYEPNW